MSGTDTGRVNRGTTGAKTQKLETMWSVSETSLEHQSTKCEGWSSIKSWGGKVCRSCTVKGLSCHVEEFGFCSRNNAVVVQSRPTLCSWTATHQASLSFTIPELLRSMSLELVMLSHHLLLCRPLLLLPSVFPSIRVFSNGSARNNREPLKGLEKAEEPEIKLPTSAGSSKKQESSRKRSISALLTMPKPLTVWITINCGKF